MVFTGLWAILSVVLLVGTVGGWHWIDVNHPPIERRIGSPARRVVQSLVLPSGLALSAAAGVVLVSRVGTTGTMVRWTQGEVEYAIPAAVLRSAAEVLAVLGLIGLGIGLLACGIGYLSRTVAA